MFDQLRLKEVITAYKQVFVSKQWGDEKYKWEAVRWFQDNWDNILNVSDANALEHEKISHTTVKYKTILPIIRF